ncbi:MAG: hypothetical protein AB8B80_16995 [Marinicellaceae bacterium]
MKKTTLIGGLLLSTIINAQTFTTNPNGQANTINTGFAGDGATVLASDPSDVSTILGLNSVHCGDMGVHADNSYFRFFDLSSAGLGELSITDIDLGVENATSGTDGSQPIIIRVWSLAQGDTFPGGNLTLVDEFNTTVMDGATGTVANFPYDNPVSFDSSVNNMVVEVNTPDLEEGHGFFFGSNDSSQTGDFFLSAEACGITDPTPTSGINFPDFRGIIVVNGFGNVPVDLMNFSID